MGLVYSQCCNQVIDTNLRYTAKPLLKLEEAKFEQEKLKEKDKKVEAGAKTKENELLNTKKDEFKSDNFIDYLA